MDLSTRQGRREQGQLIQKAVERAGLSVEELANRIGCSRALIYQYLSGTTLAQPDRLQQIAAETGVSLAYFYGGGDERKGRRGTDREDAQARFDERIRQLEELAHAQESPPDWSALASTCERIVSLASQFEEDAAEARALLRLGKARVRMGEFSRASDSLMRAGELFGSLDDPIGEADARQTLGHAYLALGRTQEAKEQFEWVARSDRWGARWSGAVSLAAVYEQQGDYRRAMECCDEAASLLEEAGDPSEAARGMLYVNANRVNLYLACGDFTSAQVLAEKCLEDAEAQGNSDQHLEARLNLGFCAFHQGRWALARRTLTSGVQLARFLGDKSRASMARATLAMVLAALCDCDACIELAKDALAMALSQGDHRAELFAQLALADAYFTMGRDSEARYHANQALGVATALRLTLYEAEARLRTAALYLHNHELADAQEPIERALATAGNLGARHLEARGLVLRGDYRFQTEDLDGARADALSAIALSRELGTVPVEWEAQALLARVDCAVGPPLLEEADEASGRAVALIEQVRSELREAGIADTLLEDKGRQEIYLLRAKVFADSGRPDEATAFIEQAAWPPLSARTRGKRRAQ
jgi:tetratricopeptide (TPR) repeat protein